MIDGTGAFRTDDAGSDARRQAGGHRPAGTQRRPARIYDRLYWVLGLTFGILALGGTMLYRRGVA